MSKNKIIGIIAIVVLIIILSFSFSNFSKNMELVSIKSEKQLEDIYNGKISVSGNLFKNILTMPISIINYNNRITSTARSSLTYETAGFDSILTTDTEGGPSVTFNNNSTTSKDYSTTNIQVENVDEADITKTDGDYIYSISDNNVIITNVIEPSDIKISSKIQINNGIPEELILYKNKLVIISVNNTNISSVYLKYDNNANTIVKVYNIENKENPILIKDYELMEPYYTSRCINNKLYVISSGKLRKDNDKISTYYKEDNKDINLELKNIKYLKDINTKTQTFISMLDLDNPTENVSLNSYLIDISNAYVSENNIYLLNYNRYYNSEVPPINTLFGLQGAIGPFIYASNNSSNNETKIYKFKILEDGTIDYDGKTKVKGETINQFSIDEYNSNLRVALHDDDGSRIVVFNDKLEKIGESSYLAKGEQMYSSRFLGDKAYLVTYKVTDPLYVIDVSNPNNPKVLGELKIPGYSTYLHPYDENYLIGIGMETQETVNRNSSGKVISTTSSIVGMKMALFDVSDVNNPIQMSNTVIGDRRATSAILTNHKALLFSKEKELIAIPVNNYEKDFQIKDTSGQYSSIINSYKSYNSSYISEGYFVYNINLEEGFKLKGVINHEKEKANYSLYNTKLLRGLYIDNNLFTISETTIKVNKLDNLELINELIIKRGK